MDTTPITLFSGLAVKDVLEQEILPGFCRANDVDVAATFKPTSELVSLINDGAKPDLMIGVRSRMDMLAGENILQKSTVRVLLRSPIGVAVPPDTPVPDISTIDALVATLTSARSVAYSRTGASGIYFTKLLDQLGVAEQVNADACILDGGFTAEALIDGRADVAVQQIIELRSVHNAHIVGPLPEGAQQQIELSIGLGANAPEKAERLLDHLWSATAATAFTAAGFDVLRGS